MYKIGDKVWIPVYQPRIRKWITCPLCLGSATMTMIFGNGETHIVECGRCQRVYEGANGLVDIYEPDISAKESIITEVIMDKEGTKYTGEGFYQSKNVYSSYEEALDKAQEYANEYKQKEMERVFKKEKDTRTWAWHVAYYKRQLKDLQKQIKYYEEKLNYGMERNSK